MPYYRIRGEVIEAPDPTAARKVADMGGIERFGRGAGLGLANIGRNVANMALPQAMEPSWATDEAITKAAENPLLQTGAGKAGSFAGELLGAAMPGGIAGGVAGKAATVLGKAARARRLAAAVAATAGGATEGAITSGPGHRVEGGLLGGALGGAVGAAMPAVAKFAANPVKSTPAARELMKKGVDLTPGQMNSQSFLGSLEDIISKVPFVSSARDSAKDQLVRRQLRSAAAPGTNFAGITNKALDTMPIETVAKQAYDSFGPGYDALRAAVPEVKGAEIGLAKAMRNIAADPSITAFADERKAVWKTLKNSLTALPKGKSPGFSELQLIRSQLREGARESVDNPRMQKMFLRAADEITNRMQAGMTPQQMAQLKAIDSRYADMAVLADALRRGNASPGGYTQGQLLMTLKPLEGRKFGMGGSGKELSRSARAGKQVFEEKTPITGARLIVPGAAALGLGKAALIPAGATALAATTKTGRKIAGGGTQAQKDLMRKIRVLRNSPKTMGTIGAEAAAVAPLEDY